MKKILKNQKIKYLLFTFLGVLVGGSIGITATTYVLKSSEIQYTNDKSVQQAIDELYLKAENCGSGSSETLPIGDVVAEGYTITVPYTGSYLTVGCVYGTTENYGSAGTISNNTCIFNGASSNQQLYYRISALSVNGKIYEYSGNTRTSASGVTIVKTGLPEGVKAIVYLDPTNLGTACNASNSKSTTGTKSGCMKWYAFKEDDSSYTMILDHNTTSANWNDAKGVQMNNLVLSSEWKVTPRLITGQEVADIIGDTKWRSNVYTMASMDIVIYSWLYSEYWTSTEDTTNHTAWHVGYLYDDEFDEYYYGLVDTVSCQGWGSPCVDDIIGVRPVITISKSSL